MQPTFSNIILIGMAGAGKSTIGSALAKLSGRQFVDTDDLIAAQVGMRLQDFLDRAGVKHFQKQEEQTILAIKLQNHVIATGGSTIYSSEGMTHLKKTGPVVLLDVDLQTLEKRVTNQDSRGLINPTGSSFSDLFASRQPLYDQWADIRVNATAGSPVDIANTILTLL